LAYRLHLIYTRKGADNDHVFHHRSLWFIALVASEQTTIICSTEQFVIPVRGAGLGSFGVAHITPAKSNVPYLLQFWGSGCAKRKACVNGTFSIHYQAGLIDQRITGKVVIPVKGIVQ